MNYNKYIKSKNWQEKRPFFTAKVTTLKNLTNKEFTDIISVIKTKLE